MEMTKKATIEIKKYCAAHKRQGKTFKEIQQYINMKGYNVSIATISNWIKEVDESGVLPNSDCKRYELAVKANNKIDELFKGIQVGSIILVNTESGEKEVKVLSKYANFLVCSVNGLYKESINKLEIVYAK